MENAQRFGIAITHMCRRKDLVEMPWLETEYHVDDSDWMILSEDGWRAAANGEPTIWDALERKLLVGFYVSQPQLIAVIGHPSGSKAVDAMERRQAEVRRIVRRIRSLLLPSGVLGVWTDENGSLEDILEPNVCDEKSDLELQPLH